MGWFLSLCLPARWPLAQGLVVMHDVDDELKAIVDEFSALGGHAIRKPVCLQLLFALTGLSSFMLLSFVHFDMRELVRKDMCPSQK